LALPCTYSSLRAEGLGRMRVLTPAVQQYDKVVISLIPERQPQNPFDPNEAMLDALIILPSGKQVRVPGFWFQEYHRALKNPSATENDRIEVLEKENQPEWRVHCASGELGLHHIRLELKDQSGLVRSEEQDFRVTPGSERGFVRVSPRNRQYLEYESGQP